jgi:glycosyltransferase involved in cell wall biosynthesis
MATERSLRILLLCEGDAERHVAFSGIVRSVLVGLRARGHTVVCGDTDLSGLDRYAGALQTFSLDRKRWGVRYRLGGPVFRARTRNAARHVECEASRADVIFQIGATFRPSGHGSTPYVLYCDSNIQAAVRETSSGFSPANSLSASEIAAVTEREGEVYRSASAVFTLSERLRESFIEDFGLPPERVHAVYAGPNLELDSLPDQQDLESTRDEAPPTILFVGGQFHRKGGDTLLEAFEAVRERVPEARLLIVGPPQAEAPPREGVEWLGFLDKDDAVQWRRLVDAYASSHVFCLPTRLEPFGIVFVEAMLFGLPCVGADTWAVPEIIEDGQTGYIVPPNSVSALADRLSTLLVQRGLTHEMGRKARARANELFVWETVVDRMLEVIRERVLV